MAMDVAGENGVYSEEEWSAQESPGWQQKQESRLVQYDDATSVAAFSTSHGCSPQKSNSNIINTMTMPAMGRK